MPADGTRNADFFDLIKEIRDNWAIVRELPYFKQSPWFSARAPKMVWIHWVVYNTRRRLARMGYNEAAGRYAEYWLNNGECRFAVPSLSGRRRAPQRPGFASKTP
jgi:hypothetical protein